MSFKEKLLKLARKKAREKKYSSKEYRAMLKMNKIMQTYEEIEKLGFDPLCGIKGDENYINARFAANAFLTALIDSLTKGESKQYIENAVNAGIVNENK